MAELTDAELEAAEARGEEAMRTQPRAASARYDPETGRVVVELVNGCTYVFPAALAQELHGADDEALAGVVIDGVGFNLHWPALDADLYVPALVAGVFGTRDWMAREWGAHGRQRDLARQGRGVAGERRQGRAAAQARRGLTPMPRIEPEAIAAVLRAAEAGPRPGGPSPTRPNSAPGRSSPTRGRTTSASLGASGATR